MKTHVSAMKAGNFLLNFKKQTWKVPFHLFQRYPLLWLVGFFARVNLRGGTVQCRYTCMYLQFVQEKIVRNSVFTHNWFPSM